MSLTTDIPDFSEQTFSKEDVSELEYGKLESKDYLYVSKFNPEKAISDPVEDEPPYFVSITTYISYLILIIIGHVRDFFGKIFKPNDYEDLVEKDGYAPWLDGFESFYTRRLKNRIDDCFARPIHGVPGRYVNCLERVLSSKYGYSYTGALTQCLNLSSYNYLGFAQSSGYCTRFALQCTEEYGVGAASPRRLNGTTDLHSKCEKVVAEFLGHEDALLVSQGYGTNANLFSSLVDSGCLVISDELNHASIRFGIRLSGASVKIFKHNDISDLENIIRNAISQGQPRSHRAWKKIIIAIEGLYSMEGNLCNLPAILDLKDKYKCYLFLDEAHSIGALGPNGKGVCDYFGIDSTRVDILMGTFTKSFGSTGGYISGSKVLIDRLRVDYMTNSYSESIPPPVLAQIMSSLSVIQGVADPGDGVERLQRIAFNSRYLRLGLKRLGFIVYGADDSPIIPVLLFLPAKMPALSRMLYESKIAVVVVGYPAVPLSSARVRLCVSSSLTKSDLDYVLRKFDEIGDKILLKFSTGIGGGSKLNGQPPRWKIEEVLARNVEDCKKDLLS